MSYIILLILQLGAFAVENIVFKDQKTCAQLTWVKGPSASKETAFQIQFLDCASKKPMDVSKPSFNLDMYEMHMSIKPPNLKPLSQSGQFEVGDLYLGMGGKWFIEIKANGQTTQFPFSF